MRRFFLRFLATVTVAHALGVVLWLVLTWSTLQANGEAHLERFMGGPTAEIVAEIRAGDSLDDLSRRYGYPLRIVPAGSVPLAARQAEALAAGRLAFDARYPEMRAWRALDEGRWVEFGPFPSVPPNAERRWVTLALFASGAITIAIAATTRRMHRDLERLADTAHAIGQGDLQARARLDPAGPLAELPGTLDDMADRIERLLEVQRETLLGVSHELRTPLARLQFALELVADAEDRDERAAEVERMQGDLAQLDRLIDELLAYLKLEAGVDTPVAAAVPILPVAREVARDAVALRADVTCALEVDAAVAARIEPRLLRRALRNLVGNALRHAKRRVVVRASGNGHVRVEVEDDGPGVPAGERERVFLPFTRLDDARGRDPRGSGLGLPIARRIARAHGGDLTVEDAPGGGARFVLVLAR